MFKRVPTMSSGKQPTDTGIADIPPEIEERLSEWEGALALIDQTGRVDRFEVNAKRWELGRAMQAAIGDLGSEQRVTHILGAIAHRLGKSRTYLYHMMWVARAWSDDLPRRPWTVLRALARLPKGERDRLNEELPLDAPASAIPRPDMPERELTPESQAGKREAAETHERMKVAEAAYRQIPSYHQPEFLLQRLREIDLAEARVVDCRRKPLAAELVAAATAIATKLRDSETDSESTPAEGDDEIDAG
jgi:hypothetical protein